MTTPVYCTECGATSKEECDCFGESPEAVAETHCPVHDLLLDDGVCHECQDAFEGWEWGQEAEDYDPFEDLNEQDSD